VVTRSAGVPYPIALVITGLALGVLLRSPLPFLSGLELHAIPLTSHRILVLFLPALLAVLSPRVFTQLEADERATGQ
jgi:hypothetical protein